MTQQDRATAVLVSEMPTAVSEMMSEVMPAMYTAMTQVYVERFSLAEIQAVQTFYDSAAGRKSVTVMLEDAPRLTQPMMQAMQAHTPRLQQRMQAAMERLKQEGIESRQPGR